MSKHINTLDGIRGAAALLVLFSHSGNMGIFFTITGTGQLGVMLFFTLSGFLMSYLYAYRDFSWKLFYKYSVKRFFRVYPSYALIIVVSFFLFKIYSRWYAMTKEELVKHILLQGQIDVFWTIPVELKFYLLFLVILLVMVFLPHKYKPWFGLILWIGLLIFPLRGNKLSLWPYLEYFVGGMAGGLIFHAVQIKKKTILWDTIFTLSFIAIILAIPRIFEALFGFSHAMWKDSWAFSPLMTICVLSGAFSQMWVPKILGNKIAKFYGSISFSLYLLHLPLLRLVKDAIPPSTILLIIPYFWPLPYKLIIGILSLALATLVSYLWYRSIENPSRKLGAKLASLADYERRGKESLLTK